MKVLIYSAHSTTPHLETDLEIAKNHLDKNDEVIFLRCESNLPSCLVNPLHLKEICKQCIKKYNDGLEQISNKNLKVTTLSSYSYKNSFIKNFKPKTFKDLKKYKYKNLDLGDSVLSTLIARFNRNHFFDVTKKRYWIEKEAKMVFQIYEQALELLAEEKPKLVYLFNGRFSTHRPILRACEKLKIDYFTHERGSDIHKYMLRKNAMPHDLKINKAEIKKYWGSGSPMKRRIGSSFFIDRAAGISHSWVSFTKYQKVNLLPKFFDKNKINISIFNSTIEEYITIPGWENKIYNDENHGIARILESFKDNSKYHFYLRIHPNLKNTRNFQIKEIEHLNKYYDNLTVIFPEENVDTYRLMHASNKIITFGSTMGVEAAYWGKPSLLLGRSLYEDLNCCYVPKSHAELVSLLKINLLKKPKINAVKYGYWQMKFGVRFKHFIPYNLFFGKFLSSDLSSKTIFQRIKFKLLTSFSIYFFKFHSK